MKKLLSPDELARDARFERVDMSERFADKRTANRDVDGEPGVSSRNQRRLTPDTPGASDAARSLTVHNAKAADYGLRIGLIWWVIGMALCTGYFVFLYRHFAGKVKLDADHEGY